MTDTQGRSWRCAAYGPEGPALCFVERVAGPCASAQQCRTQMASERQRLFRRINELAANGDPLMAAISDEFTDPSALLNATDDGAQPPPEG